MAIDDEIQIPAAALINCKAKIGDKLAVERIEGPLKTADSVAVSFTSQFSSDDFTKIYAREVLVGIGYVRPGQLVDVSINGARRRLCVDSVYAGSSAEPLGESEGAIVSRDTTQVSIKKSKASATSNQAAAATYNSIGGLDQEIAEVRKLVETSLKEPQIFAEYGLQPPRGVLLFGPPGTGKTLIARAVAAESQAFVHVINGAEIMNKFYGETESKLREMFDEARKHSPSIIFIDEIDALCPMRSEGESEVGKRVVATLLALMDGIAGCAGDRVVVIAATNRPNAVDAALRRPGRFDREIEVPIPSPQARMHILRKKMSTTPNSLTSAQMESLAADTHGFVGADLEALVREAAVIAIKRNAELELLKVSDEDMQSAMKLVKPSTMREVALEIPNVKWSDIGGQEATKQLLKESVEWPLKHPEAFQRMGIRPPKGVLLYGPPGKWVGESEKAVRELFRKARAAAPSIVFFDEIDALTVKRGSSGDGTSVADRVLSQLLTELDGIEPLVSVTVVAATNRPDVIDAGILRPDRIDRLIYVGPPDLATRCEILKLQFKKIACAESVSIPALAEKTDGFSGAEVVSLCQEAAMEAMTEDINARSIKMRHFERCLKGFKKRITPEMLQFYADFRKSH
ncbi:AAA+-type ATPase [Dipsacomyces acuminosporus]|nr:AAA+-type ATPase [Dipsacomyces acuminosporus]